MRISTHLILHDLRGGRSNQAFASMNSPMRLRQHGTLFSFSQKICTECKFFVKKPGIFRPAGGEISFWVSNRVTRVI